MLAIRLPMKISILDDYHDTVRMLSCFGRLAGHEVTIFDDPVQDTDALAARLAGTEALVLIRECTQIRALLLEKLPHLKLIWPAQRLPAYRHRGCTGPSWRPSVSTNRSRCATRPIRSSICRTSYARRISATLPGMNKKCSSWISSIKYLPMQLASRSMWSIPTCSKVRGGEAVSVLIYAGSRPLALMTRFASGVMRKAIKAFAASG